MGDQKNQGMQDPSKEPERKQQGERAGQKPQDKREKDRASNPDQPANQDPQFDPSHIKESGEGRESSR
jgi:hypothetical protein